MLNALVANFVVLLIPSVLGTYCTSSSDCYDWDELYCCDNQRCCDWGDFMDMAEEDYWWIYVTVFGSLFLVALVFILVCCFCPILCCVNSSCNRKRGQVIQPAPAATLPPATLQVTPESGYANTGYTFTTSTPANYSPYYSQPMTTQQNNFSSAFPTNQQPPIYANSTSYGFNPISTGK